MSSPLVIDRAPASQRDRMIYLHGFRSSPKSFKAQWLATRMAEVGFGAQFVCPQLPASPRDAVNLVRMQFDLQPSDTLVGSSLGGYYATWLAERFGCRAALLNPATHAARDLGSQVGRHTMYHSDEPFEFRREYMYELSELEVPVISFPERYFLIAAKGDELLDWREMVDRYRGSPSHVLDGSDHGLSDFDQYGDLVLQFAGFSRRS